MELWSIMWQLPMCPIGHVPHWPCAPLPMCPITPVPHLDLCIIMSMCPITPVPHLDLCIIMDKCPIAHVGDWTHGQWATWVMGHIGIIMCRSRLGTCKMGNGAHG